VSLVAVWNVAALEIASVAVAVSETAEPNVIKEDGLSVAVEDSDTAALIWKKDEVASVAVAVSAVLTAKV
jgi:hypothetical protein